MLDGELAVTDACETMLEPTELAIMAVKAYGDHNRTGAMDSIDRALAMAAPSVNCTSPHSDQSSEHINTYDTMLGARYEWTGEMADLEAAIRSVQHAIVATAGNHPEQASFLHNLATMLDKRYKRTHDLTDVKYAIEAAQQAVDSIAEGHPGKVDLSSNLANDLGSRFDCMSEMADLKAAVEAYQRAVNPAPEDDSTWAANYTSDQAIWYTSRQLSKQHSWQSPLSQTPIRIGQVGLRIWEITWEVVMSGLATLAT